MTGKHALFLNQPVPFGTADNSPAIHCRGGGIDGLRRVPSGTADQKGSPWWIAAFWIATFHRISKKQGLLPSNQPFPGKHGLSRTKERRKGSENGGLDSVQYCRTVYFNQGGTCDNIRAQTHPLNNTKKRKWLFGERGGMPVPISTFFLKDLFDGIGNQYSVGPAFQVFFPGVF